MNVINSQLKTDTEIDPNGDGFSQCPKCKEDACLSVLHRIYVNDVRYMSLMFEHFVACDYVGDL